MRKTLLCMLMSASILASSAVAFAVPDTKDVYNGVSDSLVDLDTTGGVTPSNHKTILISRVADINGEPVTPEYVYVDQNVSPFSSAVEFMLEGKAAEYGYYKAQFGGVSNTGDSTGAESVYFIKGDFTVNPNDKMTVVDEPDDYGVDKYDGNTKYYKKGFSFETTCDKLANYKSIKLINEKGTECIGAIALNGTDGKWDWEKYTGVGEVTIALQVYGIPEDNVGFKMYLSVEDAVPVQ